MSKEYICLSEFLRKPVVVPVIQRDYAQGRIDKWSVRVRFLESIKDALCADRGTAEKLRLDFIYGADDGEGGEFAPLDGQQRLTTLWLLHWYIAAKTPGVLGAGNPASKMLANFSYKTRVTSREFCANLSCLTLPVAGDAAGVIRNQKWYSNSYDCDPTVQGMLKTITGVNKVDLTILGLNKITADDVKDGIEKVFGGRCDYAALWERLVSPESCPVVFYLKDMKDEDMPMSDDLYIKMNARGKPLTEFENFKADWLGYSPDKNNPEDKLISDVSDAALIDTSWTDVFWSRRGDNVTIDETYFAFLQMYFLNWFIAESVSGSDVMSRGRLDQVAIDGLPQQPLYKHLYKYQTDNNIRMTPYAGFAPYADIMVRNDVFSDLKSLFAGIATMDAIPEIGAYLSDVLNLRHLGEERPATMAQRVEMYAVCRYLEVVKNPTKISFEDWKRVVRNIIQCTWFENEATMASAIRLFRELSSRCADKVVEAMAQDEFRLDSDFGRDDVILEEKRKAHLIQKFRSGEIGVNWEQLLCEAESNEFLRGMIGVLLPSEDYDSYCRGGGAEKFTSMLANVDKYFDKNGVRPEFSRPVSRALLNSLGSWQLIYNSSVCFNTSTDSWRRHCLRKDGPIRRSVEKILKADDISKMSIVPFCKDEAGKEALREQLFRSGLFDMPGVVANGSKWRFRAYGLMAFYPKRSSTPYVMDAQGAGIETCLRNKLLIGNDEIHLKDDHYSRDVKMFTVWDVQFEYNGHRFIWSQGDNAVHLADALTLCFAGKNVLDRNTLQNKLDELIERNSSKRD